ncbi:MAG: hypothetical protein ACPHIA_08020, partial [Alphaproteobacteria bacterium]
MRFLARLFALAFAIFAILFAAANHDEVTLRLWPFPYVANLPIYAAVLGAAVLRAAVVLAALVLAALEVARSIPATCSPTRAGTTPPATLLSSMTSA